MKEEGEKALNSEKNLFGEKLRGKLVKDTRTPRHRNIRAARSVVYGCAHFLRAGPGHDGVPVAFRMESAE